MLRIATATAIVLAVFVTGCSPEQENGDVAPSSYSWPGDDWTVSTLEAEGFNPAAINRFVEDLRVGRYGLVNHFLLIRHGRVVVDEKFERDYESIAATVRPDEKVGINTHDPQYDYDDTDFHPYYDGTDMHSVQSVTKSVTSAALGVALDENYIEGVDVPALPFFGEYDFDNSDPRKAAISLADLLTMRSGIDWRTEGGYQESSHSTVGLESSDTWIQFVLDRPMDADPGTVFEYNDGVAVLLGKVVGVATGKRIDKWTEERLFAPIGIDTYYWKITPDGEADSMGGLYLTAHDLARIGYLFLREGIWRDKRLLSESWVRQSITSHVADIAPENNEENSGYGFQWWLPERKVDEPMAYLARGFGGQRLTVIPDLDIVIVFNGWDIRGDYGLAERTFRQEVLPAALMQ